VVFNSETGTTTQGETVEEALANLRSEYFLEELANEALKEHRAGKTKPLILDKL